MVKAMCQKVCNAMCRAMCGIAAAAVIALAAVAIASSFASAECRLNKIVKACEGSPSPAECALLRQQQCQNALDAYRRVTDAAERQFASTRDAAERQLDRIERFLTHAVSMMTVSVATVQIALAVAAVVVLLVALTWVLTVAMPRAFAGGVNHGRSSGSEWSNHAEPGGRIGGGPPVGGDAASNVDDDRDGDDVVCNGSAAVVGKRDRKQGCGAGDGDYGNDGVSWSSMSPDAKLVYAQFVTKSNDNRVIFGWNNASPIRGEEDETKVAKVGLRDGVQVRKPNGGWIKLSGVVDKEKFVSIIDTLVTNAGYEVTAARELPAGFDPPLRG